MRGLTAKVTNNQFGTPELRLTLVINKVDGPDVYTAYFEEYPENTYGVGAVPGEAVVDLVGNICEAPEDEPTFLDLFEGVE